MLKNVRIPDPNRNRKAICQDSSYGKRKGRTGRRMRILSRDAFTCNKCSEPYPESALEVDHVTPLFMGGSDNDHNLQTLCVNCHREKSRTEIEYRKLKPK